MNGKEILIFGRVQGIGLRRRIKKFAEENMLKGFVRNEEDGSVRIIVHGNEKSIKKFIEWLEANPRFSKIENIIVSEKKVLKKYDNFFIEKKDSFFIDQFKSFFNLFKYSFNNFENSNNKIPIHIGIIPDGNRRWAKLRRLKKTAGHEKSAEYSNIFSLFDEARKLGVKYISIWGFSTENWKRDDEEKKVIFDLILKILKKMKKDCDKNKIRFRHFGRKDRLPKKLVKKILDMEKETKNYSDFNVNLCLDYGGRDEILRAVNKILKFNRDRKKINEKTFSEYLDSKKIPDIDLIIRTSGEKRTSGFMPFQSVYSEFYFVKKPFPLFNKKDLRKAILDFGKRKRRFGGN